MIIHDKLEQGTDEWKALRAGKATGSKFADIMSKGRGKAPSKTRLSYMRQLAAETITGEPIFIPPNAAMKWGTETEPQARAFYELDQDVEVVEVGAIQHNDFILVSPDGLVEEVGMVEFKCPNTATHIDYYLSGDLPELYKAQVMGQMWVAEREFCDFMSYDPRVLTNADHFIKRVYRDDEYIKTLSETVYQFVDELKELLEKLK